MNEKSQQPHSAAAGTLGAPLAVELGGNLPCVRCKYNLRGLSIRGGCPECGTAIKATLLAVVDPRAGELRPIRHRYLVAAGIVLWALAGLLSVASAAAVEITIAAGLGAGQFYPGDVVRMLPAVLAGLSGLGALALVRPHGGLSRGGIVMAAAGVIAYVPLVGMLGWIGRFGEAEVSPGGWPLTARGGVQGMVWIGVDALLIVICIMLRPNGRRLAARSLLMRTGRVDRQTLRALALVLIFSLVGHGMGVAGAMFPTNAELLGLLGGLLTTVGYGFLLLGMVGVVLDCARIASVIAAKPLDLAWVVPTQRTAAYDRPSRAVLHGRPKGEVVGGVVNPP